MNEEQKKIYRMDMDDSKAISILTEMLIDCKSSDALNFALDFLDARGYKIVHGHVEARPARKAAEKIISDYRSNFSNMNLTGVLYTLIDSIESVY